MNNNNDSRYVQEDEIDLRELWNTLVKKKILITILTSVITIAGIIFAYSKTPIYEARALVEIGNYKLDNVDTNNNSKTNAILDNPSTLVKKLNILFIDMLKDEKDRLASISSINISKGANEFLEIKSLSTSNNLSENEILKVVKYIQKEHKKILDDVKENRERKIKNIDSQIYDIHNKFIPLLDNKIKFQKIILKNYNNDIKKIKENLLKIEKINPSLSALKLMEKRDLVKISMTLNLDILDMLARKENLITTSINNLKDEKLRISTLMLPHNYKNTQIIGKIITHDYAVKPKKKLIVIVSFITGFILSIFLVFFLDFIGKKEDQTV